MTAAALYDLDTPTTVAVSRQRLERLVSPRTGVVVSVVELLRFPDEPGLPYTGAYTAASWTLDDDGARLVRTESADGIGVLGGGTYPEPDQAYVSALGEAAERYSAGYVPVEKLISASWRELGEEALHPDELRFFIEAQYGADGFPFRPLDETTAIHWVRAHRLSDGAETLVPAQLVYLNGRLPVFKHREPRLAPQTSNGLACGATATEAATGGLLELLERDAFLIAWYNRLSLPVVSFEDDPEAVAFFDSFLRGTGLRFSAVDLSDFHGIPSVLGVTRGSLGDLDPVSVGGAVRSSPLRAWQKALIESSHVRAWIRNRDRRELERMRGAAPSDVRTFDDRMVYYSFGEHAAHASFLDASDVTRRLSDLPKVPSAPGAFLKHLVDNLAGRGIETYYVDVSSPDIADVGISVARVLAPALCPLPPDERAICLGVPRLRAAAEELGFVAGEELNPHPHPYP